MCYNTNAKGLPIDGQPSKIGLKVITACLRPGGYFFLFTVTTSAMIDTINNLLSECNENQLAFITDIVKSTKDALEKYEEK